MGNNACKLCVSIVKTKRKIRKHAGSSTTVPSFAGLDLENFWEAYAAPAAVNGIPPFICEICIESKPLSDSFNMEGCSHFFCTKCTIKYLVFKLQDKILNLVCPASGRSGVLNPSHCKPILPNSVSEWWEKALSESMIPESVKFYCPFNDCSALLINDCHKGEFLTDSTCPHCKRSFCVQCKAPWHPELTCEKFQRMKHKHDDLILDLAKRRNWKRCPKCKHYVEKIDGCNDMKCRCNHRFCYRCGSSIYDFYNSHACFD